MPMVLVWVLMERSLWYDSMFRWDCLLLLLSLGCMLDKAASLTFCAARWSSLCSNRYCISMDLLVLVVVLSEEDV
jgi:hypothetical protein